MLDNNTSDPNATKRTSSPIWQLWRILSQKTDYVVTTKKSNETPLTNATSPSTHGICESGNYKTISEDNNLQQQTVVKPQVAEKELSTNSNANGNENSTTTNTSPTTMVQDEKAVNDGADEQMLGTEDDKLALRRDEVKFIKGDHQNGDAKIDIGIVNGKAFTGMTKEELMKYANDPFWVRLRWIFFIAFWAIWIGMLVGAILIIVDAPKCAAPEPLPWYKRGLHAKFGDVDSAKPEDIKTAAKIQAAGAIYELPSTLTYKVRQPEVEAKIKKIIEHYKGTDVKLILDLTPNVVGADSQLFKDALENEHKRSAFIWVDDNGNKEPTNWIKIGGNTTAWSKVGSSYVLSQFDDGTYDLRMNDTIVRREFGDVLEHLLELGVHGFRLKNTKFFMVSVNLEDETHALVPKDYSLGMESYGFYNHFQTSFQKGLGDMLYDYMAEVKNITADAFLSVAEDLIEPEAYKTSDRANVLGIDLPMYGQFLKIVSSRVDRPLQGDLQRTRMAVGNDSWLQWNMADIYHDTPMNPSAIALFMSLLPGVPVVPVDSVSYERVSQQIYEQIAVLRKSPSYMHGELRIYDAEALIAYSTIKSGNPGYFVVFNPTSHTQTGNFTNLNDLPDIMTVVHVSDNYLNNNSTDIAVKQRLEVATIQLEPYSTVILTYVPLKAE